MNKKLFLPILLLTSLALPSKVLAHAVETNYLFSSELELESKYSTGEPLEGAEVVIYAPNDSSKPWMVGKTDKNGKFSFLPDSSIQGEWQVEINQEGHEDYLTVPVGEKGVEVENISQIHKSDVHYASSNLNSWIKVAALAGIAGVGVSVWAFRLRKQIKES